MTGREVFVYDTHVDGLDQRVVSIVDPETVFHGAGLPAEAIIGVLRDGATGVSVDSFLQNRVFVEYLGRLIAAHVGSIDGVRREAERQGSGYVYLLDGRTPTPDGAVPPIDILGAVAVDGGEVVQGTYRHNPNHRLLTADGFFLLPAELESVLQTELRARCAGPLS